MFSPASQFALLASVVLGPFWTVGVFLLGIRWTKKSNGYLSILAKSVPLSFLTFIPTVALESHLRWGFMQKFGLKAVYMTMSELLVFFPSQFITMFGVLAGIRYFYTSSSREAK